MTRTSEMDYSTQKKVLSYLARIYRSSKTMLEIYQLENADTDNQDYKDKLEFVTIIDRTIAGCRSEHRFILNGTFFYALPKNWYCEYYSPSTYYRLKKSAVQEFMEIIPYLND